MVEAVGEHDLLRTLQGTVRGQYTIGNYDKNSAGETDHEIGLNILDKRGDTQKFLPDYIKEKLRLRQEIQNSMVLKRKWKK